MSIDKKPLTLSDFGEIALARTIGMLYKEINRRLTAIAERERRHLTKDDYREMSMRLSTSFLGKSNVWRIVACNDEGKKPYQIMAPTTLLGYNQYLGLLLKYFDSGRTFSDSEQKAWEETRHYPILFKSSFTPYTRVATETELRLGKAAVIDEIAQNNRGLQIPRVYMIEEVYAEAPKLVGRAGNKTNCRVMVDDAVKRDALAKGDNNQQQSESIKNHKEEKMANVPAKKADVLDNAVISMFDVGRIDAERYTSDEKLYTDDGQELTRGAHGYLFYKNGSRYDGLAYTEQNNSDAASDEKQ